MTRDRGEARTSASPRWARLRSAFVGPAGVAGLFTAWALGVLAVALAGASTVVVVSEGRRLREEAVRQARRLAREVGALVAAGEGDTASRLVALEGRAVRRLVVRDLEGRVAWTFGIEPGVPIGEPHLGAVVEATRGRYTVEVAVAAAPIRRRLLDLAGRLVASLGLALGGALAVGLLLLRGLSAPLERLATWAREPGAAIPVPPPEVAGPREVHELRGAFAALVARLAADRAELVASEARFRELFEAAPAPLLVVDRKARIVRANRSAEPFLGVPAGRAVGVRLRRFIAEGDAVLPEDGESGPGREVRWRLPDGTTAAVALAVRRLGWPDGEAFLVALTDLTDRLRRAGELWRRTFDAMRDGVAVLGPGGEARLVNAAFEGFPPGLLVEAAARLAAGRTGEWEREEDGRHLLVRLEPLPDGGAILVARDVTERVAAERRLREALKAESVAALANGVAHDFNNLLAALELHARLLEADPAGAAESVAAIHELTARGREAVSQLLETAREGGERAELDLAGLVRESEGFVRFLLGPEIALDLDAGEPVRVVASPVELRRVLLNLVLNAREAVRGVQGARVEIRVGRDGEEAWFEVADNGVGVPEELRDRIFEPYVTRTGTGLGLGLASVAAIAAAHGGRVELRPCAEGAVFRVILPSPGGDGTGAIG